MWVGRGRHGIVGWDWNQDRMSGERGMTANGYGVSFWVIKMSENYG